jgi:hypothetical protein
MSLRERVRAASAAAVKTEIVETLGERFEVRGMMQGERLRVAGAEQRGGVEKSVPMMLALCVYDPETGKPLWNANSFEDVQEINALPPDAADALQAAAQRLSGLADDAEGNSPPQETSISLSPSSGSESEAVPSPISASA